jgi:hypothetical protein
MTALKALQAVDSYRNSSLLFSRALRRSPYGTRLGRVAHPPINKVIHRNTDRANSGFKNKHLEAFSVNFAKIHRCVVGVGAIQRASVQREGLKKNGLKPSGWLKARDPRQPSIPAEPVRKNDPNPIPNRACQAKNFTPRPCLCTKTVIQLLDMLHSGVRVRANHQNALSR